VNREGGGLARVGVSKKHKIRYKRETVPLKGEGGGMQGGEGGAGRIHKRGGAGKAIKKSA